jgi:hypothetical protein
MKQSLHKKNQLFRMIIPGIAVLVITFLPHKLLFDENSIVCLHYYFLGIQCPFCGMTRAIYELMHFRILSAISYHFVVLFFPVYFIMDIITFFNPRKELITLRKLVFVLILAGFLVIYLFRIAGYFLHH